MLRNTLLCSPEAYELIKRKSSRGEELPKWMTGLEVVSSKKCTGFAAFHFDDDGQQVQVRLSDLVPASSGDEPDGFWG